ncbi:AfsR/SARP family transcriptional regulator [Streptomyces sp. NBC_00271]|uniref:AfsR/SARP family transcriptional regulator n=1 Tax=Streptomyces sp. NBC_00271 TaxID=2975697 RepID=UPI002E2B160D|nr:BTAD domain-containing putative transcriptional regulator [Streptomyces sp. NBC_00271]
MPAYLRQEQVPDSRSAPDIMHDELRFALLGPVRAWRRGIEVDLGSPQQRAVWLALLLEGGRPVTVHHLVDAVWGNTPPVGAVSTVRTYVSRLRKALEPERTVGRPPQLVLSVAGGYVLRTAGTSVVDMAEFETRVSEAMLLKRAGELQAAAGRLRTALDAWQGTPLAGIPGPLAEAERGRLAERRVSVHEARVELDLRLGCHDDVVPELAALCSQHPLRERLHALLMLALYRCGRQAEALATYHAARRLLVEELGVEPGAELRDMYQRLLAADPALMHTSRAHETGGEVSAPGLVSGRTPARAVGQVLTPTADRVGRPAMDVPVSGPAPAITEPWREDHPFPETASKSTATADRHFSAGLSVRPRQLPADLSVFTGRVAELARATSLVPGPHEPSAVITIHGMAGVGKTAFAVRLAHTVAHHFPEGQLYMDLRSFGPVGTAVEPSAAIRAFLIALDIAPEQIPPYAEAQAALYRSALANRRLLIVLDNARDSDHVRSLLPGTPGCMVVVTSRNQLMGLVAAHGAQPIALDVLDDGDADRLIINRVGTARTSTEPEAVRDIVEACARWPLALAIVAARAATHPAFPLSTIAAELHDARGSLDAFESSDPTMDVRAVFSWSYQVLPCASAQLFRLLALHPGCSISLQSAASLAGLPHREVQPLLAELTRAHLITECEHRRYVFHDLLHNYAAELSEAMDSAEVRPAALLRLFDHYMHTAYNAAVLLTPNVREIFLPPPAEGSFPLHFDDTSDASAWLDREREIILAVIELADAENSKTHSSRLAQILIGSTPWAFMRGWMASPGRLIRKMDRHAT